jgi:hypothetical protein
LQGYEALSTGTEGSPRRGAIHRFSVLDTRRDCTEYTTERGLLEKAGPAGEDLPRSSAGERGGLIPGMFGIFSRLVAYPRQGRLPPRRGNYGMKKPVRRR